jgi:uncharacterized protein involved in outer membrane biogenesis
MHGVDREWVARLLGGRWRRVLLSLALFAALVRIALPYILVPLLVSQADAALVGWVELGSLDLSLIRGGVTLHDLAVHLGERPAASPGAAASPAGATTPPLFEAKRLWTQISWLALFTRTLRVEDFELESFAVRLDRLETGLALPALAPAAGDSASAAAPSPALQPDSTP